VRAGRVAFLRDCSGATAIEFAFVVGPLLLLFVGIIEVGRLMWSGHALDEVAIAGARCVGIHAPDCANGETLEPDRQSPISGRRRSPGGSCWNRATSALRRTPVVPLKPGFSVSR